MTSAVKHRLALAGVLAAAFALRAVWPLADPADRLSWSNGVYTDPAHVTHAARNAVLFGEWVRDSSRDLVFYPLLNALTWVVYRVFGVSRLSTQLLAAVFGTVAVAATAWAVGRARGRGAALLAGSLAGVSFWLAMFSRVPVAENLVVALLALSCVAALGRSRSAHVLAGVAAGVAALFGKIHALAFLPALLVFLAWGRRPAAAVPALLGFALAAAAWAVLVFVPFRAQILDQAQHANELYGAMPALGSPAAAAEELVWTLRASWLFHRMPVLGALAGLFVVGALAGAETRRRRIEDGTAIFALWFVAAWAFATVLPYKAPRYFLPAALPLVAAGACALHELARGHALLPTGRGRTVTLAVWTLLSGIVAVDVAIHGLSWLQDRLQPSFLPVAVSLRETAAGLMSFLRPAGVHVAVGTVLGVGAFAAAHRIRWSGGLPPRRLAVVLGTLVVAFQVAQFTGWAGHRIYAIERAKESLDAVVGPDAVLLGPFAPLLVQDSRRVGVPQFGEAARGVIEEHGVTHVVLGSTSDAATLARAEPGLQDRLTLVREWPFRTRHVHALQLQRVRGTDYEPTEFERGAEALQVGRPEEALRALARFRRSGEAATADVPALEARCHFDLGDETSAREHLERAIALRPDDPGDWYNLGNLRGRAGDPDGARAAWRRALALDPYDSGVVEALRQLGP